MAAPRILAVGCLLCGLLCAGTAASTEPDTPQDLFDLGVGHMEAGRFDVACLLIEQSYKKDPRPGTLFTLAECEAARGFSASAVARYDEYLAMFAELPADKKAQQGTRPTEARAQTASLRPRVPTLVLLMPPYAPAQTVVKRDGKVVPSSALGTEMPIDPGDHILTTQAPGGPVTEARVTLSAGQKMRVALDVVRAPSPIPVKAEPAPDARSQRHRAALITTGSLGVAALLVSGVTGALALEQKGVVDDMCSGGVCTLKGKEAADLMQTLGWTSTISLGVGLVGVGVAAVLLITSPSKKVSSAGGGPWVTAGVTTATRDGATLGIQGAW
jgi:hypothetical protein